MPKTIRRQRLSTATSLAVAAMAFLPVITITWIALFVVCMSGHTLAGVVLGCPLAGFIDFLLLRGLFMLLRWRVVVDDGRHCTNCGYDLTGNVSGVCSECGEAAEI